MTRKFVLSPVGTSILANTARLIKADVQKIIHNSNVKSESDISADDLSVLRRVIEEAENKLKDADSATAAKMSAELNGIIKIYSGAFNHQGDFHLLLCTDTWLGEVTANIAKDWLTGKGVIAEVRRQKDLRTDDLSSFQVALADIVRFCEETAEGYRRNGYRVIFNLTGGFKSVQGFLQTLALFYADETFYVFESSEELLRIPRLPVRMDAEKTVREHLQVFRRLSLGLKVDQEEIKKLPETFLLQIDNEYTLSEWGELVWQRTRDSIYRERVFQSPSDRIVYSQSFLKSIEGLSPDRLIQINKKIDDLTRYLETGQHVQSLDFKKLRGDELLPSTHEIDAWHDQDAKRIYGHFEEDKFVLDKLDRKLG